jgi:hypothetical protein
VHKYFGILCLVADLFRKAAMILMRMREDDPPHIGDPYSMAPQLPAKAIGGFSRFWPDVDKRYRVLFDEVDVDIANVKRRRDGNRNDLHYLRLSIRNLRLSK